MARIQKEGISLEGTERMLGKEFPDAEHFYRALSNLKNSKPAEREFILASAEIDPMEVTVETLETIDFDSDWISEREKNDLMKLEGRKFIHKWQLDEALAEISPSWRLKENDKKYNENLKNKLSHLYEKFRYPNQ